MNQLLSWLADSDLRSDGSGTEVADLVLENLDLLSDLLEGLDEPNEAVRGHAAHALERVSRFRPDKLLDRLPKLIRSVKTDKVAMVRWHIAMILGNLAAFKEHAQVITATLLDLLHDDSAFVRSWAIASLCIVGRQYPAKSERIITRIAPLLQDDSIAVRNRARRAVDLLMHDRRPLPASWVKSERLGHLSDGDSIARVSRRQVNSAARPPGGFKASEKSFTATVRTCEHIKDLIDGVTGWASEQPDIKAVALVGSYARNAATETSDIDLVILADEPAKYLENTEWVRQFGQVAKQQVEPYGQVTSLRVWYISGHEVEYGITTPDWAARPLDEGTQRVIQDGMKVLLERQVLLSPYLND